MTDRLDDVATPRPALVRLDMDQQQTLEELRAGFVKRDDVVRWMQEATIYSLGTLPHRFYPAIGREGALLDAMLQRGAVESQFGTAPAREIRRRIESEFLAPAFTRAIRLIRWSTTEHVQDESDGDTASLPDPDEQRSTAMRPALEDLQARQADTLDRLIEGFDDRDEILAWTKDLNLATRGEVDPDLTGWIYRSEARVEMLLGEFDGARRARVEEIGVGEVREDGPNWGLLPWFSRAAREVAQRAREGIDRDQQQSGGGHI